MVRPLLAAAAAAQIAVAAASTPVDTASMKVFGHSIKNVRASRPRARHRLAPRDSPRRHGRSHRVLSCPAATQQGHLVGQTEIDLLRHECSAPPCVITQMHCPSANGKYDSVVKLYIDGETEPSIAMTLKELAMVGHLAGDGGPAPAPPPPAPSPDPTVRPNYTEYTLGKMGATCAETCSAEGLVCSPLINTGYGVDKGKEMQQHLAKYNASVTSCTMDSRPWFAVDQPGYVCGNDPNGLTHHCVGAQDTPRLPRPPL